LVEDSIQDVVERIHRHADRGRNAGDLTGEQEAREAALRAQEARSVEEAQGIEQALQQSSSEEDAPVVGPELVPKKKKKGWFRRLFGGGSDDDDFMDNS
jgi:hypothetical protein